MDFGLKIVGGILVVVGGVYVLTKTKAGKKAWAAVKEGSPTVARTISDGCATLKQQCSKLTESFSEGYAEVVDNVTSKTEG